MCSLLLSGSWYHARWFNPMKGTPKLISFEEKPDLAGEVLLFHIRKSITEPSLYNQGKRAISQTPQTRVWMQNSGKQPLLFSPLEFSYMLLVINQCVASCSFISYSLLNKIQVFTGDKKYFLLLLGTSWFCC